MEIGEILETEADTEGYPAITSLVPMPNPQDREARLLRSLTHNPRLRELYARISQGGREPGGPRPFWPI